MKSKSKYSFVSIAVAAIAVLVMFLPCLNGVSIMQYVWYPNDYETEYFKAPLTKGLIKVNGSLQKVEDADVAGAKEYAEDYKKYMEDLVSEEKEFDAAKEKFRADSKTVEEVSKETDVKIAKYNAPVEKISGLAEALKEKIDAFDGDLNASLDSMAKAYSSIESSKALKAELSGIAKILAGKYENTDVMIEAAAAAGEKYNAMSKKISAMRGDVVTLTATDDAELRSIVEDRKTLVDKDAELKNLQGVRDIKFVDIENANAVIETIKARLDAAPEEAAEEIDVAALRTEFSGDSVEADKAMLAEDIKAVEALIEAKKEEIKALDAEIAGVEKEIAGIKGSIAAHEEEIAQLDSSNDFLVYKTASILSKIAADNAAAEQEIVTASNYVRGASDFNPIKTKAAFDEKINAVPGLSAKFADLAKTVDSKAVVAKENKLVVEDIDFTNLDLSNSTLKTVNEIINRPYFDTYISNSSLEENEPGSYTASVLEISKILYLEPEATHAVYEAIESKVAAARDKEDEYINAKNKKLENVELSEASKSEYAAAEEKFNSFVTSFEESRVASDLYANSMEYLELVKSLYEAKVEVKDNKAAIAETEKQNVSLEKDIALLKPLSIFGEDTTGDDLDEINEAVKADVQAYVDEYAVAKSLGLSLSFYDYKVSNGNALRDDIELNANYKHNAAAVEDYKESNEELAKSQEDYLAKIEEMKASGLVEVQLTGNEYKEMINDDDVLIDWYNYFINNEVRFFLYIMILFIVVVLFALFVKFWQMNVIANCLFGITLLATFFCSDLLFVGSLFVRIVYLLLALAALCNTFMLFKEAQAKKAEE